MIIQSHLYHQFGSDEENTISFYNTLDYNLSTTSSDVIFNLKELKNYKDEILKNKNKFTSKTLTLSYDGKYHIVSCKNNYSDEDILKDKYNEMLKNFNNYSIEYNISENPTSPEITNFETISSIYSQNGLEIYKNTFNLLDFKNEKVYIKTEEFNLLDNLFSSKLSNISKNKNEISCTVTSYLYNSNYNINNLSDLVQINNEFKLIKENNIWKIDYFNINFSNT